MTDERTERRERVARVLYERAYGPRSLWAAAYPWQRTEYLAMADTILLLLPERVQVGVVTASGLLLHVSTGAAGEPVYVERTSGEEAVSDKRTDEKCEVCGSFLRAQGDYRYCPRSGFLGHIITARDVRGEG